MIIYKAALLTPFFTAHFDRQTLPKLDDILSLRPSIIEKEGEMKDNGYVWYLDNILQLVAGKRKWKRDKHNQLVTEAVSISDEAFGMIVLENNWSRWSNMALNKNTSVSSVSSKFTTKGKCNENFKGWSYDGQMRFIELAKQIKKDRRSGIGKAAEMKFLKFKQRGNSNQENDNEKSEFEKSESLKNMINITYNEFEDDSSESEEEDEESVSSNTEFMEAMSSNNDN